MGLGEVPSSMPANAAAARARTEAPSRPSLLLTDIAGSYALSGASWAAS